ncbi:MAG TPA: DUF3750 domain-containing protein [Cycloclasticus sp.]|jgi:hypothetical protein|nr:DUF3750 domain-containing protein [Cycloclasticus sp.]HIL91317.1 DUF3750 domain-containing protein [Cycloclasticus sp.]
MKNNASNKWLIRRTWILMGALVLMITLPIISMAISSGRSDFNKRHSANIAPLPSDTKEAVLQIYAADAYGWRGIFAVHTWIAIKPVNADTYTTYQVFGWNQRSGRPVLTIKEDIPDRFWFGSDPKLLADYRGEQALALIPNVIAAVNSYPFPDNYTLWPGPNSNSFTEWVSLEVPELGLKLPLSAIGKDWMKRHHEELTSTN